MDADVSPITLLQLRNLELKLGRQPSEKVVSLLCNTVWGTPGGMRYQHLDTAVKIHDLHDPWYLYTEKENEVIGVLCLDQRRAGSLDAFYIRYFSFAEGMRRKEVAAKASEAPASKGQGAFKRFANTFFGQPTALLEAAGTPKAVFYAFVELENARSRDMVAQMGLQACGQFQTLFFSRFFPRKQANVRRARPVEYTSLRAIVREAYADHAFFEDHGLFYQDDFFVIEVNGQIVAGCQAHRIHWRIVEIPGFSGKLMMHVLPRVPLLSRVFNPHKFDFAAIEGLFCLPGHAPLLQDLLEGILEIQGLHTALIWLSKDAAMYQQLQSHVRMGLLQKLKKNVSATVVMRGYGLSDAEIADLLAKPVYVSAFDGT
jgi:hypothetical protein